MTDLQSHTHSQPLKDESQGWKAQLNLGFEKRARRTVLASRSQSGPLTVQRPFYPEGDVCHLYLLHPPGGVVGGDELHINVDVKQSANALITTPGATKFYRNNGKFAKQVQTLKVESQACLEWFPQENIFFDDTHTQLTTQIELAESATFMGWEINCYGRPASKDFFKTGKVDTRLKITRNHIPLLFDRLNINTAETLQSTLQNPLHNSLHSPASLNSYPCFGTFIATGVTTELLEKSRQAIADIANIGGNQTVGLTLMDDVLVARCLGQYAEQISNTFKCIWITVRPEVSKREACLPRIWST